MLAMSSIWCVIHHRTASICSPGFPRIPLDKTIAKIPVPGFKNLQHTSMNRISGGTFFSKAPRCHTPDARLQEWPKSKVDNTAGSEMGILEPNGGFVKT